MGKYTRAASRYKGIQTVELDANLFYGCFPENGNIVVSGGYSYTVICSSPLQNEKYMITAHVYQKAEPEPHKKRPCKEYQSNVNRILLEDTL